MKTKPIEKIDLTLGYDVESRIDILIPRMALKLNELIDQTNTNTSRIEDLASKGNIKFMEGENG